MNIPTCTRRLQWCMGHRVYQHESKCANIHGHNYVGYFHARVAKSLDSIGRVIDFGVLKQRIGGWIDGYWDHGMVLFVDDPIADDWHGSFEVEHKLFVLPCNPTAENLASYLLHDVCPHVLADTDVEVYKVVLWETENCFATAEK